MSTEFRIFVVYFATMMALLIAGPAVPDAIKIAIAAIFIGVGITLTIRSRRQAAWRWPGIGPLDILRTIVMIGLMAAFVAASTSFTPFPAENITPWFLMLGGIIVMNMLQSLRLTYLSEVDFLADCRSTEGDATRSARSAVPSEPTWKNVARNVFSAVFCLVWLNGIGTFYVLGNALHNGSPRPTATQTERLSNHGRFVYIEPTQKHLIDTLTAIMMITTAACLACGFALQFVFGVKLIRRAVSILKCNGGFGSQGCIQVFVVDFTRRAEVEHLSWS